MVFFFDDLRGIFHGLGAAHLGGGQQDGDVVPHQLQGVPVPGGDIAVVVRPDGGRERAEDVIRLVPLLFHDDVTEFGQEILEDRHLLGQFLRHAFATGLVLVVHLVAERRAFEVKRNGHGVRLRGLLQFEEDVQKAGDGVGESPVLRGQQFDAVEGPVDDAVAVDDQ